MSPLLSHHRALAGAVLLLACSNSTGPNTDCTNLPLAPESARVDLAAPVFSNPLNVTNALFPITRLHSAILLGTEDGLPLRVETTLLPTPKTITVNGQAVQANESQYVAFLDGRILEVALDWYAQADGGAVWYLGEDVFNYEDGVVADREGTWQAGRDGPPAMIMPASPKVGDAYRAENVCPVVFEEVTVTRVGVTVTGPTGPVSGAIMVSELHMDGSREEKTFAPGYGEFFTGGGTDVEAMALAIPADAVAGAVPPAVTSIFDGAMSAFDDAATGAWSSVSSRLAAMNTAWSSYRTGAPPLLVTQMNTALGTLGTATTARNANAARLAAIAVARAALDFRLRYRPPAEIDRTRFDLWAAQVLVDAAASNAAFVRGDATALEWVRDRFAHTLASASRTLLDNALRDLRTAADSRDFQAAASAAARLRVAVASGQ